MSSTFTCDKKDGHPENLVRAQYHVSSMNLKADDYPLNTREMDLCQPHFKEWLENMLSGAIRDGYEYGFKRYN